MKLKRNGNDGADEERVVLGHKFGEDEAQQKVGNDLQVLKNLSLAGLLN